MTVKKLEALLARLAFAHAKKHGLAKDKNQIKLTLRVKREIPVWSSDLTPEDWDLVNTACAGSKWYQVIQLLEGNGNTPLDLRMLDELLAGMIDRKYAGSHAKEILNQLFGKTKIPIKLRKTEQATHTYTGKIRLFKKIKP